MSSHSFSMVSPTFCMSDFNWADGAYTVMPFFFSRSRYSPVFFSLVAQPRFSASAAAFSRPSCVGLSRASKAFLLATTAFFGSQACVSAKNFRCS